MYASMFNGCAGLTSIPAGLFGDLSGAPAANMFANTFQGCGLTSIPAGLFGDLSGAPVANMFANTFRGCTNLAGPSALMADGATPLYERFPAATATHVSMCYR